MSISRALIFFTLVGSFGCRPAMNSAGPGPAGDPTGKGDLELGPSDATPRDQPDGGPLPGADLSGVTDYCNALDPRSAPPEVFATPEAGEQPYVDVLMKAQQSIRVEIYLMGYGGILTTLLDKAKAGIPVEVLLDKSEIGANQKYFDQLTAAGAQVQWSDPQFTYQHAKFFVVDGAEAVISTGNYSLTYSILLERNFVARLADPADVADLVALFDADWQRKTPDMSCTRLVISPVNSRDRILALINGAKKTLTIESMQFADKDVRAAVAARNAAGVDVRAILADTSFVSTNADAATFLKGLGIPVKHNPHMHTKVLVADGTVGYLGSENLSYTSLDKNREVGIITDDATSVAPLMSTFEADWTIGVDF
jgi:phosphatidylserine/phosphatidylglycerophosphate/cardiolipin synthase-like enzyme